MTRSIRCSIAVLAFVSLSILQVSDESESRATATKDAPGLQLIWLLDTASSQPSKLQYEVVNTSTAAVEIPRVSLPFGPKANTHLLIASGGNVHHRATDMDAGFPVLSDLEPIVLRPGDTYRGTVALSVVLGTGVGDGRCDMAGFWIARIRRGGESILSTVHIPSRSVAPCDRSEDRSSRE